MPALLAAALYVTVLPPHAREVPAEAVRAAVQAMTTSLPPPFAPRQIDAALFAEHLAAAGPACRVDPVCVCSVAALEAGTRALDLDLSPALSGAAWAADLKFFAPCDNALLDRRALLVEPNAEALASFLTGAATEMLRGRDLSRPRYAAVGPAAPAPPRAEPVRTMVSPKTPPPPKVQPVPRAFGRAASEADVRYRRGLSLANAGDRAMAAEEFAAALKLNPGHVGAALALGRVRLSLEQPDLALVAYENAHRIAPALGEPLCGMAEASRKLDMRGDAFRWYERCAASQDLAESTRAEARKWVEALRRGVR